MAVMQNSYCHPVKQLWDVCALLRHLSIVQANPPGVKLVARRKTHNERSQNPEFYNDPNTIWWDKDSWVFAPPDLHQVPIGVTAGWTASPVDSKPTGPHLNSWVDRSKCDLSFLLKETMP